MKKVQLFFLALIHIALLNAQPYTLTITSSVSDGALPTGVTVTGSNPKIIQFSGTSNVSLNPATILLSLNGGSDVQLVTSGSRRTIILDADISKTSGDEATLTIAASERVMINLGRTIESTSDKLNIVLRSDIDVSDNNAGSSQSGTIKTNGGHFWMGGTSTNGGIANWSGLTVGDGPSRGSTSANWGAADFEGLIDTRVQSNLTTGGNVLIWASTGEWHGLAIRKAVSAGVDPKILAGNGSITLITKYLRNWDNRNATLEIETTGVITLASPSETNAKWGSFDWANSGSGSDLTLNYINGHSPSSETRPIKILNYANTSGICIGSYDGMTSSSSNIFTYKNDASTTISSSLSVSGTVKINAGSLSVNENIASTSGGAISLYCNSMSFASNKIISSTGELIVAPLSTSNTVGVAGGAGTLQITSTHLSTNFSNGFSNITIGDASQSGLITVDAFTLQDDLTLASSGGVTLGGAITMGANNITIGSNTSVTATSSNYFKTTGTGVVKRNIANSASFTFPVGNTYYNPVAITNNNVASDLFNVRVVDAVYVNGSSGTTVTAPRVNATWHIGKTLSNAGSGVNFSFSWNTAQEQNSISTYRLQHSNGTSWAMASGTSASPSLSGSTKTMSHTGYTGTFSPFAIGESTITLPVTWQSFIAEKQGTASLLKWSTASEQNTKDFEVQHSTNTLSWTPLGTVAAAGNSTTTRQYSFTHATPFKGNVYNYYRILQRDLDGKFSYSKIASLIYDEPGPDVFVYPNPATEVVTVYLAESQDVRLINVAGATVWKGNLSSGRNQIPLTRLAKGVYWIVTGSVKKQLLIQ
jgi:Secretion system C-terminal sorting domain